MPHYRIEYLSHDTQPGKRMSFPVPDVTTALVVAEIMQPEGDVELWDGEQQLARLRRESGDAFWQLG